MPLALTIFNFLISAINLFAITYFVCSAQNKLKEAEYYRNEEEEPYSPLLVAIALTLTMVSPVTNCLFISTSINILREPAKKLWKKIRAKISIWRH